MVVYFVKVYLENTESEENSLVFSECLLSDNSCSCVYESRSARLDILCDSDQISCLSYGSFILGSPDGT